MRSNLVLAGRQVGCLIVNRLEPAGYQTKIRFADRLRPDLDGIPAAALTMGLEVWPVMPEHD